MRGTLTTGPAADKSGQPSRANGPAPITTDTGHIAGIQRRLAPYAVLVVIALVMFGMTYAARVRPATVIDNPDVVRTASPQPSRGI
jgi:hypothetical protein